MPAIPILINLDSRMYLLWFGKDCLIQSYNVDVYVFEIPALSTKSCEESPNLYSQYPIPQEKEVG